MKSYACYPNGRTRFQAPMGGFVNPYFTQTTNDEIGRNHVATRPAANIIREEGAYKIQLAVPGVSKDQIKIEFIDGQLIISATPAEATDNQKFVRKEFDYAGFKRTFRLHKNADTAATHASFDQGLLTIVIPDLAQVTTKINIL